MEKFLLLLPSLHCPGVVKHSGGYLKMYRGADKSLDRPTSRGILFDGENAFLMLILFIYIYTYIYINSINITPITIINRIYEHQNLLSL